MQLKHLQLSDTPPQATLSTQNFLRVPEGRGSAAGRDRVSEKLLSAGLVQPPSIFNMKRHSDQGRVMPSPQEELRIIQGKFY